MAKGNHSPEPFSDETRHKQAVWEEFLERAVNAGNQAIGWLECDDLEGDESISEDEFGQIYLARWESTGDVVMAVLNFLWPEIESMAVKLGVPFEPEIGEINYESE